MFYDFAHKNFRDRFVFYLLRYFQKIHPLAYIFKNMNSMYCNIIKYLCSTLHCITFILMQVWNPPNISWLIFLSSVQPGFPSTVFYRAFPFWGKGYPLSFPDHRPVLEWPTPARRSLRHKNACILAIQRDDLKFESCTIFILLWK